MIRYLAIVSLINVDNFIANKFHTIAEASAIIFNLRRQFLN